MSTPTKPARTAGKLVPKDDWLYGADYGQPVATTGENLSHHNSSDDAAHLAACWNLVEDYGGDPEAVRRALDTTRAALDEIDKQDEREPLFKLGHIVNAVRAALDALGRRP